MQFSSDNELRHNKNRPASTRLCCELWIFRRNVVFMCFTRRTNNCMLSIAVDAWTVESKIVQNSECVMCANFQIWNVWRKWDGLRWQNSAARLTQKHFDRAPMSCDCKLNRVHCVFKCINAFSINQNKCGWAHVSFLLVSGSTSTHHTQNAKWQIRDGFRCNRMPSIHEMCAVFDTNEWKSRLHYDLTNKKKVHRLCCAPIGLSSVKPVYYIILNLSSINQH